MYACAYDLYTGTMHAWHYGDYCLYPLAASPICDQPNATFIRTFSLYNFDKG